MIRLSTDKTFTFRILDSLCRGGRTPGKDCICHTRKNHYAASCTYMSGLLFGV